MWCIKQNPLGSHLPPLLLSTLLDLSCYVKRLYRSQSFVRPATVIGNGCHLDIAKCPLGLTFGGPSKES